MTFNTWIDTFFSEKHIDREQTLSVNGDSGLNLIPVGVVVDAIKGASRAEQAQIKNTLVAIDFRNGDALHFVKHLAQALAH